MAIIGVDLDPDTLILTRGRDFKWAFQNLDANKNPVNFPAGQLYFELATGGENSAHQTIDQVGASAGTYNLAIDTNQSAAIPFDGSQDVVRAAIEAIPNVGVGNVSVVGTYVPTWYFVTNWTTALALNPVIVQAFNTAVTAAFNALNWLDGNTVSLQGSYTATSFTFVMSLNGNLLENAFATFAAGALTDIVNVINAALGAVEHFTGFIALTTVTYAPSRHFDVNFINGKALTPVSKMVVTPSLSGVNPTMSVNQITPGRAKFTIWPFSISGSSAGIEIQSEDADAIADRTKWQLVFLPSGEAAGGDPLALGLVKVQPR